MKKALLTAAAIATLSTSAMAGQYTDIKEATVNGFNIKCETNKINDMKMCHVWKLTLGGLHITKNVYRDNDYVINILGHDFPNARGAYRVDDKITMRFSEGNSDGLVHLDYFKDGGTFKVEYSSWPKGKEYAEYSIDGIGEAIEMLENMADEYHPK